MANYKLTESGVIETESGMNIPADPANRHWQEYQVWLGEGNTPEDEHTLQELKDAKKEEIDQWRDAAKQQPVTYNSVDYDGNDRSQANLNSTLTSIQAGVAIPNPLSWRAADNTNHDLTHVQLAELSGVMFAMVNAAYEHSWDLKAQADAAADEAAIDAIVW
jgi:hypothetical protein